jgi:23S rRNA pseudouridine2605 synthase
MKERIQKVLAAAGIAARRKVEQMVREGRVAVNGEVRIELPILIDPERDRVTVDDELVKLASPDQRLSPRLYIILNKPVGVYSTSVAQGEQLRAIDLLPPRLPGRVYPVGRLDAQAKGLLLLTNDGELTHQLTHPRYGVSKTYRVSVDGRVTEETAGNLERGVWLSDGTHKGGFKTGKCRVKLLKRSRDRSMLELTLNEGRNVQLRRMLAKMGHKVRDLTRVRLGPLTLVGLSAGQSRLLSPKEVRQLKEWTARPRETTAVSPSDRAAAT